LVAVDRPEVTALIQVLLDLQRRLVVVVGPTVITVLAHLVDQAVDQIKIQAAVVQELLVKEMQEVLRQGHSLETQPVAVVVLAQ
jgi:hypothetical protein